MKAALDMVFEYNAILRDGFWPMSRVSASFKDEFTKIDDICEDSDKDEHFV